MSAFSAALVLLLLVVHLGVAPLTLGEVGYIALLAAVMTALVLGVDYLRQRAFRREVARRLAQDDADDLAPLPRGASREQRAFTELLERAQQAMQAELQRRRAAAEHHRSFVDLWVHQMKTPAAVLELTARQQSAGEAADPAWDSVAEEVEQLGHGLDLMLQTARLERFELDLKPATVDLAAAAREAVNDLKRSWLRSGVYPKVAASSGATGAERVTAEGVTAETDPKWLQVVLRQLLTNAIKYSSAGQQVVVGVTAGDAGAVITVTDRGRGIPPEDVPRVFERFYTGTNGRSGPVSTGMGLYLAAEICRRLGHTLELESSVGEGTAATLTIRPRGVHRLDA